MESNKGQLRTAISELGATLIWKLKKGIESQSYTTTLTMVCCIGLVVWIKIMRDDHKREYDRNLLIQEKQDRRISLLEKKQETKDNNWNYIVSKQFQTNNDLLLMVSEYLKNERHEHH